MQNSLQRLTENVNNLTQCKHNLDIAISYKDKIIGGIHAKVSLGERVSDDVPTSTKIMENGYVSYLVTLDVKSFPLSPTMTEQRAYLNKGELGTPTNPTDKRQYIEEHGSFDACFSYNLRTTPSPANTTSGKRIFVCRFDGSWDNLCDELLSVVNETD